MIVVSATKLRNTLFDCLDKVKAGETVVVKRNNVEVARLIPAGEADWRKRMKTRPRIVAPPEEIVKPLSDVWEDYV